MQEFNYNIVLWVDDERPMPEGYTHHVKSYEEAIQLLLTGLVVKISLDHDLGQEKTGYDIAKWIEENAHNGSLKKFHCRVHSQNIIGKENIKMSLQSAMKVWNANCSS